MINVYNYRSFTMNENGRLVRYARNPVDHVRIRGIRLIRRYAARRKPFFLQAGFVAPHTGGPVEADDPIAVNGANASSHPAFHRVPQRLQPSHAAAQAVDPRARHDGQAVDEGNLEPSTMGFPGGPPAAPGVLLSINKAVNKMIDALVATGEAQQTLVVLRRTTGTCSVNTAASARRSATRSRRETH